MASPRDRRGGGCRGSFVSLFGEKVSFFCEKETHVLFPRVVHVVVPLVICYSPFPLLCPPPGSGSILASPLEERKRPGLLHLLPRGKGDGGVRGPPLLCVIIAVAPPVPFIPLLLPLLLPLSPHSPPPPRCVYCCVFLSPTG